MKKFLSFLFFVAITVIVNAQGLATGVEMKGDVKDGSLVFTFENRSNKTIANCNFKLELPEGITVKPKGKKYMYEEGDATEGMTFTVSFAKGKYTITVYDGEFDETAGNTIISLPLEGELAGQATVSSIAFGDPDGNNISRPEDFKVDLSTTPAPTPTGSVELMGEVKDGSLVFTFENTTGKTISNCAFQFTLPDGMTLALNGSTYKYEKGDATAGMTFSIGRNSNKYTVMVNGGKFNESAGNTIITLPLEGTSGGKATVSDIVFADASGNVLSHPDGFTLNIPSITPPPTPTSDVELKGEVKDGNLVFTFENKSGKTIANCNFKLTLPEGVSVKPKGKKYMYEEGDATEGMTFSIAFKNSQYTITIYDGEFDETAGNTIISLPLEGELAGQATVSSIAFGDADGNNICRPEDFKVDLATTPTPTPTGSVDMMGEVKDGSLVFTFENTTGKTISNCTFQFTLPDGMTLAPNGSTYKYEKGDATAGMTFSIGRNSNKYTVTVNGGKFNEAAGNTIITLPLEGTSGGKATVSNIAFADASGNVLSRPDGFTLNIPSITPPPTPTSDVELKGEVKDGNLVFTFENKSDKIIANCNFTLALPEGVTLVPKKSKFEYKEGDATEGMTFSVKQCSGTTDKWNITVYDGEFDETAGNTIITLPLQGTSGGEATVSNIAFGDRDGNNISRPADFTVNIPSITITGSVDMKGEVKDVWYLHLRTPQKGILLIATSNLCSLRVSQ